jgi:hypothetical protein
MVTIGFAALSTIVWACCFRHSRDEKLVPFSTEPEAARYAGPCGRLLARVRRPATVDEEPWRQQVREARQPFCAAASARTSAGRFVNRLPSEISPSSALHVTYASRILAVRDGAGRRSAPSLRPRRRLGDLRHLTASGTPASHRIDFCSYRTIERPDGYAPEELREANPWLRGFVGFLCDSCGVAHARHAGRRLRHNRHHIDRCTKIPAL